MPVSGIDFVIVVLYFCAILGIGYYSMKKISDFDDYAVAGRNIPLALLFATMAATLTGGGATIGRVSFVYETGIVAFIAVLGVAFSQAVSGLYVAPRVREMGKVYTVSDIMGYYYGSAGSLLSAIISFIYCISIFGIQILAMGRILQTITGYPLVPMTIIASLITIAYTWGGGMLAVIYTDAVQFIILIAGITTAALIGLNQMGGMSVVIDKVSAIDASHLLLDGGWSIAKLASFFLAFALGEALAPYFIQRYATTKSARDSKWGVTLFGVYYIFCTAIVIVIGLLGIILYPETNKDLVFTQFIRESLPVGLVGLTFGGLVAAVMSTGDSILNTAATIFTRDIYNKHINPNADGKTLLKQSKIITLVVGVGGVIISILIPSVFDLMIYTFKLWAPGIVPTMAIALLWGSPLERKVSPYAGPPAIVAGMLTTIIWLNFLNEPYGIPALVAGVTANLLVFITVQIITSAKKPQGAYVPEEIAQ